MQEKLVITYSWRNADTGLPPKTEHESALRETALEQIGEGLREVIVQGGRLRDNIHMDGDPEDGVPYTGTWEVESHS